MGRSLMDFEVIAENALCPGRRLLVGSDGSGYLQLGAAQAPIPVSDDDFARLQAMSHYRQSTRSLSFAAWREGYPALAD